MLTRSLFLITAVSLSIADESTPLIAIKILFTSNFGESEGCNSNNKSVNSFIEISDASRSNFSVRNDFFAPPINFTVIIII